MWLGDLSYDIATTFSALTGCLQPKAYDAPDWEFGDHHKTLPDPHPEADRWIAASAAEREKLRREAEEKHARVIAYFGHQERLEAADLKATSHRWRIKNRDRHLMNCRRWDAAHRKERAAAARARRARARVLAGKPATRIKIVRTPEELREMQRACDRRRAEKRKLQRRMANMTPERAEHRRRKNREYKRAERSKK